MNNKSLPVLLLFFQTLIMGAVAVADDTAPMAPIEMLVGTCVACHGTGGVSEGPAIPSIAGFTRNYLIGAMLAYKYHDDPDTLEKVIEEKGEAYEDVIAFSRYSTIMSRLSPGYTLAEIEAIADYFSAQQPRAPRQQTDAAMAKMGKKLHEAKCEKCHEDGGTSPVDDVGILAGQWMPYLHYTLRDYYEKRRKMPKKMRTKLRELQEEYGAESVEQLVHYYGSAR